MFEGIHLENFIADELIRPGQASVLDENEALINYNDKSQIDKISGDADYILHGNGKFMLPICMEPNLKEELNYIETFGYLYAGRQFYTKRVSLASYLIIYTYSGQGMLIYDGKKYDLMPDTFLWIDCRRPHEYFTVGDHWEHSSLHFDGINVQTYYQQYMQDDCPTIAGMDRENFQLDLESLLRCAQHTHAGAELETEILLNTLLFHAIKQKLLTTAKAPEYIVYLRQYIGSHLSHDFSLDELAEFANISKYHLAREFKKYTGYSLNDYIIQLRLDRACYYLKHVDISISQVCEIVGFKNYSNFYKLFEKKYHMSPRAYKK